VLIAVMMIEQDDVDDSEILKTTIFGLASITLWLWAAFLLLCGCCGCCCFFWCEAGRQSLLVGAQAAVMGAVLVVWRLGFCDQESFLHLLGAPLTGVAPFALLFLVAASIIFVVCSVRRLRQDAMMRSGSPRRWDSAVVVYPPEEVDSGPSQVQVGYATETTPIIMGSHDPIPPRSYVEASAPPAESHWGASPRTRGALFGSAHVS